MNVGAEFNSSSRSLLGLSEPVMAHNPSNEQLLDPEKNKIACLRTKILFLKISFCKDGKLQLIKKTYPCSISVF